MALNNVDADLIRRILDLAKFLHDSETNLQDANIQFDSNITGLKARLAAEPDGGQADLDALNLNGLTVQELNDIAFVVTTQVQTAVTSGRVALAAVRKVL